MKAAETAASVKRRRIFDSIWQKPPTINLTMKSEHSHSRVTRSTFPYTTESERYMNGCSTARTMWKNRAFLNSPELRPKGSPALLDAVPLWLQDDLAKYIAGIQHLMRLARIGERQRRVNRRR